MLYKLSNIYKHRVRYADTDKMGIVYNGNYLTYFEIGRTELIRNLGLPYSSVEKEGYHLPLTEASIKYVKPAYYDDILDIGCEIDFDPSALKLVFDYKVSKEGELLCSGQTTHVFIRSATGRPVRPPAFFVDQLAKHHEK